MKRNTKQIIEILFLINIFSLTSCSLKSNNLFVKNEYFHLNSNKDFFVSGKILHSDVLKVLKKVNKSKQFSNNKIIRLKVYYDDIILLYIENNKEWRTLIVFHKCPKGSNWKIIHTLSESVDNNIEESNSLTLIDFLGVD